MSVRFKFQGSSHNRHFKRNASSHAQLLMQWWLTTECQIKQLPLIAGRHCSTWQHCTIQINTNYLALWWADLQNLKITAQGRLSPTQYSYLERDSIPIRGFTRGLKHHSINYYIKTAWDRVVLVLPRVVYIKRFYCTVTQTGKTTPNKVSDC